MRVGPAATEGLRHLAAMDDDLTNRDVLLAIYSEVRTIKWILATVFVAGLLAVLLSIAEST
jgi:hypothetical protein